MAFKVPSTRQEIYDSTATIVKNNLPNSNPWKRLSWLKALLIGLACLFFDLYQSLLQLIDAFFDDTTYGDYLKRKASFVNITIDPALQSSGNVSFIGIVGGTIPINKILVNKNGALYTVQSTVIIANVLVTLTSINYTSGVATAVFPVAHNLATGMTILIAGATPSELNGSKLITVIDSLTITFTTLTGGTSSASGTITSSIDMATSSIVSNAVGVDKNMLCGDTLSLSSGEFHVDNTAFVTVDGISGGADQETEENMRTRYIYKKQNPVTTFNESAIIEEAKKISFVKRVFVYRITPSVGQVTIYFLKENNGIPTAGEIATVKAAINALSPCNTDAADIFVYAPTPLVTNFTITSLLPNTASMKQSVKDKLTAYFLDNTNVGTTITVNELTSIIQTTIDTENGDTVASFTLTAPATPIIPSASEIPTLGTVTFV